MGFRECDWIRMPQEKACWWAVTNIVMNVTGFIKGDKCPHQLSSVRVLRPFCFVLYVMYCYIAPVTVAARCKAWTVFARSKTGIVGSNSTRGMDVCVRFFCVYVVLCGSRGLATGWSPAKESYRLCIALRKCKSGQGPTKGSRTIERTGSIKGL
jgi:hypothetical protein